jgi:hypothetical protein
LTEFCWNSMRWGMMRDGQLFQPQKWEPRTLENESGFLPTPTASEYGSGNNGVWDGVPAANPKAPSLSTRARKWIPTPAARDGKDGWTPLPHGRHSDSVAVAVARRGHVGYLNPRFVEVMMGFPIGWTDLSASVTAWLSKPRAKRSKGLQGSEASA